MKKNRLPLLRVASPLVLALAATGCGIEERDRLRGELATSEADCAKFKAKAEALEASGRREREIALEGARKIEAELGLARAEARSAADALAAAKAAAPSNAAPSEETKKEIERLEAHRDELTEWVEKELLPVAEASDKRLANLRDAAADMAAEVERTRGLSFKHPFMRRLITRTQVGEWMRRDLKKDLTEEDARKLVTVGAEFGFLAPKTDIYAVFSQFLEAGAAAFYKPETRTFYHIEGNDGRGARPVVFHELVHAVEDQHFDLDAFYRAVEKDNDMALARRAVCEGSACHFAAKYEAAHPEDVRAMNAAQSTPEMAQKQMKMMASVPPMLVATFGLYPYKNAPAWLDAIGADDAAALEGLYKDPPVSTEQVLHPSKFALKGPRDYPHLVGVPDVAAALGTGFENLEDNSMGELSLGILLTQLAQGGKYAPTLIGVLDMKTQGIGFRGPAKTASEGWDGDRYSAWMETATGTVTVVWTTVWDSVGDANEFAATYGDLLAKRVLGSAPAVRPSPLRVADAKTGRVTGLDVSGKKVVVVLSAPAAKADALFAAGAAASVAADPRDASDAR